MTRTVVLASVVFTVLLGPALDAEAGALRVQPVGSAIGTVPPTDPRLNEVGPNDPRVMRPIPNDPRLTVPTFPDQPAVRPDVPRDRDGRRHHPGDAGTQLILVPPPYVVVPATADCSVPGHWDYRWAPQSWSTSVWVDGSWSPTGQWNDSHYETQVVNSGSWQPIWIPEQSGC